MGPQVPAAASAFAWSVHWVRLLGFAVVLALRCQTPPAPSQRASVAYDVPLEHLPGPGEPLLPSAPLSEGLQLYEPLLLTHRPPTLLQPVWVVCAVIWPHRLL